MSAKQYALDRLKERDTQTAIGGAVYAAAKVLTPPQYAPVVDLVAGLLATYVAATPSTPAPAPAPASTSSPAKPKRKKK